jgi:hypothetical protein
MSNDLPHLEGSRIANIFVPETNQPLAADKERYRQKLARIALDSISQFIGLLDANGNVLEINRVALDAAGVAFPDVDGKPFWTTCWWQVSEDVRSALREAILRASQGGFVRWDTEIYRRGTEAMTIDASLTPVKDEQDNVAFITFHGREITGKKAHEFRSAQFETLLNQAPLGVYLLDAGLRILEANPIARAAFGETAGELIGTCFDQLVHAHWEKPYADEIVRILRHTLESGESYITAEHRTGREGTVDYEWRIQRALLSTGDFGVVCYFRDISDRKKAQHNANLLASIVESSDDAIISKNLNGIIMSWNRGAERLFGYTASEAIGKPIIILIPPDRLAEEPEIIERLKRGERVDHFETVRVRKDGTHLNISLTISPVKDADGTIVGASKIARDITASVRQEQALKEANTALEQANADLQQFAYSASHDLQEPLRMVTVYSQLLKETFADKLGAAGDEYIGHAVQGAARMETLLRDLRTYMQVSTANQDALEEIDAGEVLKKTLLNLEVAIKESGAAIEIAELPRLRLHEFELEQLFQNLVGNSIRYRADVPPRIQIAAILKDGAWLFSIRDNGIGIEPRFTEQVFGIFKRLHSGGQYPGTGMGLAICQRIVERRGGKIWVESEPGQGSTFYFSVPARKAR